jgi:hypothetical protein
MSSIPFALDADATSLVAAQQNQLASSQIMVAQLNGNLKVIYLTAFNNWKISVDAGRISNTNPPKPPNGYVVSVPDANGFQWPVLGNGPVCAMPPIPEDHSLSQAEIYAALPPNTIDIGRNIGGKWFSVGEKDTFAAGGITPPIPDAAGVLHTYEKYGALIGRGWYLQLS